jgi:DNA invertase Pin-like site-specific DNA recombinase
MPKIGYKRVSSYDQNLARQDLGNDIDKVFEEKVSGKSAKDRQALRDMIDYCREGDTVVVYSIDRLARDLRDLQEIIATLNAKGTSITFITEKLTFDPNGNDALAKLQLQMMGAFAEFERNIIHKRQAEGIAKAKAQGKFKGGQKRIDRERVRQLVSDGVNSTAIGRELNISRMTVHRIKNELGI